MSSQVPTSGTVMPSSSTMSFRMEKPLLREVSFWSGRVQHTAEVVGLQVGGVDHFQSALAPNLHQVIQGVAQELRTQVDSWPDRLL